jgi:AcrR family transcriptional regulator
MRAHMGFPGYAKLNHVPNLLTNIFEPCFILPAKGEETIMSYRQDDRPSADAPSDLAVVAAEPTGHERGKAQRRQLIMTTAREMIAEEGAEGLTIRAIAARAGLSPVTVYNLFGSKYSVLKDIYSEEYRNLVAYFEIRASKEPLVRLFDLIDLSTEYYLRRLPFYKTLFSNLLKNSGSEIAVTDWNTRAANVRGLLSAAVDAGHLRRDSPLDILAAIFIRIGRAISQEWVDGSVSAEQARTELGIAFKTILTSHCTVDAQQKLEWIARRYR